MRFSTRVSYSENPHAQANQRTSDNNGNPVEFLQKTKETVKYGADCYIAEKGLEVDLNLCPF